jgi:hypothetical protein
MPRPPTPRRLDSLFDSRYRYDHIYPRGRSGETLRAYDTQDGDQPVVIKRPAPQDAPPIRAGQEVSILNEKRALERLFGHPALAELKHSGTFRVGNVAHQYIVIEMATGATLEELTLEFSARGEHLPELEILVIFDKLLDLLQTAHERKIVNNDVDAKHLFWDRDTYKLKVIDWGNAVFLDENPGGITRNSDIAQTGQTLYFVLSGGKRLDAAHPELEAIAAAPLRVILSRAVSTDPAARYPDIATLRADLAEVRRPLEKTRDGAVERVRVGLTQPVTQDSLRTLTDLIQQVLGTDPGFPLAHQMLREIEKRAQELAMQGDLDAVRIYMESGNMNRAAVLLNDLRVRLGGEQPALDFLLAVCRELDGQLGIPAGLPSAIDALLKSDMAEAGRLLVMTPEPRPTVKMQQMLLAEQLTIIMPGVTLLRPHLARLESLYPSRAVIVEPPNGQGVEPLKLTYARAADTLNKFKDEPAQRARKAIEDILDLLDVISENAYNDPTRATNALRRAESIDPGNAAFGALNTYLAKLHTTIDALRRMTPDSDSVADFMNKAKSDLAAFALNDKAFGALRKDIENAITAWARAGEFISMGGRRPAVEACRAAGESIRALNPNAGRWFDDYARRIEDATHVESLSLNAALGRAVAEGWEAWDRGKVGEAKAAGEKALKSAVTEGEKRAAKRVIDLSEVLNVWLLDGVTDAARTDQVEDQVVGLFLPEEETIRRKFSAQMPNPQIYLKAMSKGIVEPLSDSSAAAPRILFLHYVLRGMLALSQEQPEEAAFWREAATKTLANARTHPAFQALDNAITRRELILEAVAALNAIRRPEDIARARTTVRAPLASAQLDYADQSLRAVEEAFRRWPDGDFRAARSSLDTALEAAKNTERKTGKDLGPFKAWLQDLVDSAEILSGARRTVEQAALVPADLPDPAVGEALQKLVDVTRQDLGEAATAQLRQWRDTYAAIREMYLDEKLSKAEKLSAFEGHFASLFIDRQPALPIFRHWHSVVRLQSDPNVAYTAEATDANTYVDNAPIDEDIPTLVRVDDQKSPRRLPLLIGAGVVIVAILAGIGGAIVLGGRTPETPAATVPQVLAQATTVIPTITLEVPTNTPFPTNTQPPTAKPFTLTPIPTNTHTVPTPTVPTATLPPTATPIVSPGVPTLVSGVGIGTPVPAAGTLIGPTLPPTAQAGNYDILTGLNAYDPARITWNKDWFSPLDKGWQLGNAALKDNSGPYIVRIDPEILTILIGAEASRRIVRMDTTLELTHYDPALLPSGNVYFGIGFESSSTGQHVTAQAMLIQANIFDLGVNVNGTFVRKTQLPVTPLNFSVVRNPDKTVSLYLDNRLIGQSNGAYAPDAPIGLYMYTSTGGVVVTVKSLNLHLE